ncbi:MAG: hypothetical protein JWO36_668 [Myxococcales bacterium]|nr:hypothetical protein [Myxococcales bacterium]
MRASLFVTLLLLASCGQTVSKDAHWQLLGQQRPSSLLAVWASSTDNVWVVGGREGTGGAPTVFHYDGTAWTAPPAGLTNVDLWQVFGFADGTVYLGGSNGTILRYSNGQFTKLATPATDIVYGLWGSASDDVWAVGGQNSGRAFVWHYQGTSFMPVTGVPADLATTGAVWKVTGRAANDVWMSCSRGYVLHWDGGALTSEMIGTTEESLFSIGCHTAGCVTAGTNTVNGVLYQNDGQGWVSHVPTIDGPVWRGVTPVGEDPYAVGMGGSVIHLTNGSWVSDPHGLTTETLHATWTDADGDVFAVGGKFERTPTIDGVLIHKGLTDLPMLP